MENCNRVLSTTNLEKETAMTKRFTTGVLVLGLTTTAFLFALSQPAEARGKGNPHPAGIVYVTSQGLFFDTFVPTTLPPHGRFQLLEPGAGPGGVSQTEFGPGDQGYVGGRWWVDANGNGEMDPDDAYVLCPLMGPGRTTP